MNRLSVVESQLSLRRLLLPCVVWARHSVCVTNWLSRWFDWSNYCRYTGTLFTERLTLSELALTSCCEQGDAYAPWLHGARGCLRLLQGN